MQLTDKVVLVTAATRGIGKAIALGCLQEGAEVYLAVRNQERAEKLIEEVGSDKLHFVYNDASKPESYQSMVDDVLKQAGRIDVLVNNFGTSDPHLDQDIEHTDIADFQKFISINLSSVFLGTQAVLKVMKEQKSGSIINISSIGGSVADISQISYGTSKAAINHMTKMIATQEAKNGIRCNAVAPGMTATDAVKEHLSDQFKDLFLKNTPLKRMGLPEEIAAAVIYFASDVSAYTTGQVLEVAGGFGIASPLYGDLSQMLNAR